MSFAKRLLLKNKTETILSIVLVISLCQNFSTVRTWPWFLCTYTESVKVPNRLHISMNLVNVFHQAFFIQATKLGNSLFIVKCLILSAICRVNNIKYRFGSPRLWINWLKSFLKHFLVFSKNFLYICVICASHLWQSYQITAIAWP